MPLLASEFLQDLHIIPRRSPNTPQISIVTSLYGVRHDILRDTLHALLNQDVDAEFLIIDDGFTGKCKSFVDDMQRQDPRISILRFQYCLGIPAIGINAAIQHAEGDIIGYQVPPYKYLPNALKTLQNSLNDKNEDCIFGLCVDSENIHPTIQGVLHAKSLINISGLTDPHLLMHSKWEEDFYARIKHLSSNHTVPSTFETNDNYLKKNLYKDLSSYAAARNNRLFTLKKETWNKIDTLDSSFLNESHLKDIFYGDIVAPYMARHWQHSKKSQIISLQYLALRHPISLLLRGGGQSASIEICYRNFERAFPDQLTLRQVSANPNELTQISEDALINFRSMDDFCDQIHIRARALGKPVFYAMDDNLLHLSELAHFQQQDRSNEHENLISYLTHADAIFTWSPVTTKSVQLYSSIAYTLSTNIEDKYTAQSKYKKKSTKLHYTTLTANIIHRAEWWQKIITDWANFFKKYESTTQLTLFYRDIQTASIYKKWFHSSNINFEKHQSHSDFLQEGKNKNFHYVITHVDESSLFSISKCPVKFLDSTVFGAILIAPSIQLYSEFQDGVHCIKVSNTSGAWSDILEYTLTMQENQHSKIWTAAQQYLKEKFTTESQYFLFFLAHKAALIQAMFGPRPSPTDKHCIFIALSSDSSKNFKMHRWAELLEFYKFRTQIIPCTHPDHESIKIQFLDNESTPKLLLVSNSSSQLRHTAQQYGIPVVTFVDTHDIAILSNMLSSEHANDLLITQSITAARQLRKTGYTNVLHTTAPPANQGWTLTQKSSNTSTLQIGIICDSDYTVRVITELFRVAENILDISIILHTHPGPCDFLCVSGNGSRVIDAALEAMSQGVIVISVFSEDVDNLIAHETNGLSFKKSNLPWISFLETFLLSDFIDINNIIKNSKNSYNARTHDDVITMDLLHAIHLSISYETITHETVTNIPSAHIQNNTPPQCDKTQNCRPNEKLLSAEALFKASKFEESLAIYHDLANTEPSARVFSGLIRTLNRMQQFDEALITSQSALQIYPDSPNLLCWAGRLCMRKSQLDVAESYFFRALTSNPEQLDALISLSQISERRKDWKKVVSLLDRCLAINPSHQRHRDWLSSQGKAYIALEDYINAEHAFNNALLQGEHVGAREGLANISFDLEDWTRARSYYNFCLDTFPSHSRSVFWKYQIGNILLINGDLDKAEIIFKDLAHKYPDKQFGFVGLRWINIHRNADITHNYNI